MWVTESPIGRVAVNLTSDRRHIELRVGQEQPEEHATAILNCTDARLIAEALLSTADEATKD
jgi:hypothetical protein